MKQTPRKPSGRDKSMFMRIAVLVVALAMFAGFIILPLIQS